MVNNVLTTDQTVSKAMSDATITTVVVTTAIIVVLVHNKAVNRDKASVHSKTIASKATIALSKPTSLLRQRSLRQANHK